MRVGKRRPFFRGLLLTVVTLGIYGLYWAYTAFHEIHRQFELDEEGREEPVVWLVLGPILPFLFLVYYWKAIENLRYVRARLGLAGGITPAAFVGLQIGPLIVFTVLVVATAFAIPAGDEVAESASVGAAGGVVALALLLSVLTYAWLQRDVNAVWDAWERRMRELREAPSPAPPVPGPSELPTNADAT